MIFSRLRFNQMFKTITLLAIVINLTLIFSNNVLFGGELLRLHVRGVSNGIIEIKLNEAIAPRHAKRIRQLTSEGAYNGVTFHRVIDGFMAQTGDIKFGNINDFKPDFVGMGGSNYPNLIEEFSDKPFVRGTVGMARSRDPDSANSQFFIMFNSAPHLNGKYTVVGRVVTGIEVVLGIKKGKPKNNGSVEFPDYIELAELASDE